MRRKNKKFAKLGLLFFTLLISLASISMSYSVWTDTLQIQTNVNTLEDYSLLNLEGYWKFDEGTGSIAHDSSLCNRNGNVYGATWTTGKVNGALYFDGPDDYVDISGIPNNPSVLTQMAWIQTTYPGDPWGWNVIMTKRHADDGSDWATLTIYNNHAVLQVDDKDYLTTIHEGTTVVNDGNWHHIAGVKDGSNYYIYVDGQLENSFFDDHPMDGSPYNFHIGHHGAWSNYFNGIIDEVKVYSRALTASEILAEYQAGL